MEWQYRPFRERIFYESELGNNERGVRKKSAVPTLKAQLIREQ